MKNEYTLNFLLIKWLCDSTFALLFVVFAWAIDMGASAYALQTAGVPIQLEGLLFVDVEPRILYHVGLTGIIIIFLINLATTLHILMKNKELGGGDYDI